MRPRVCGGEGLSRLMSCHSSPRGCWPRWCGGLGGSGADGGRPEDSKRLRLRALDGKLGWADGRGCER